ncbi:MAG: ATP-binding protein [Deltaproteobacteria bacterium]|nr:ATP-binding protein [Deltaproteobacteria bacterium]
MENPFYLQEIPVDAPFCNRLEEMQELESYSRAKANVLIYSPRRYGKTSLVKRVQKNLADRGTVTLFSDFFGVASINEVAANLTKAVFSVTYSQKSLWEKALRAIRSFRPVLKPDPEGGVSLSVEPASAGKNGLPLLEETLESLGEFIRSSPKPIHVALDEFQEIVTLKEAIKVEALLRSHIQKHRASYFFIGSRRRLLLGIFNERQRPFFQSAINYPLKKFPAAELIDFISTQFARSKRKISRESAQQMAVTVDFHPYYTQKLAFFVYEISGTVNPESIRTGLEKLLWSEKPVFEAIIQGLPSQQRLLLYALAKEPTLKMLSSRYLQKYNLGSVGGIQHSSRKLEAMDLIEKNEETGFWGLVDPVFILWLRRQSEEKL